MTKAKNLSIIYFFMLFMLISVTGLIAVSGAENIQEKDTDSKQTLNDRPVYGYVENVYLDSKRLKLKAKLDSGAKTSSLNALDVVKFERDGKNWIKFNMIDPETGEKTEFEKQIKRYVKIKQHETKNQRRPVVSMEVRLGNTHIEREFSLTSRDKFIYQVLLGRSFVNGIALIDVSRTFLASSIIVAEND